MSDTSHTVSDTSHTDFHAVNTSVGHFKKVSHTAGIYLPMMINYACVRAFSVFCEKRACSGHVAHCVGHAKKSGDPLFAENTHN